MSNIRKKNRNFTVKTSCGVLSISIIFYNDSGIHGYTLQTPGWRIQTEYKPDLKVMWNRLEGGRQRARGAISMGIQGEEMRLIPKKVCLVLERAISNDIILPSSSSFARKYTLLSSSIYRDVISSIFGRTQLGKILLLYPLSVCCRQSPPKSLSPLMVLLLSFCSSKAA